MSFPRLGHLLVLLTVTAPALSMAAKAPSPEVAKEISPEDRIALNSRWDLGYFLFQNQEYVAAAAEFEKLIKVLPNDPSLLALIGSCYSMAGRWEEGEKALLKAKAQNPEDDDINGLLGQFYASMGQPLKGAEYLEHSLRITPEQDDVRSHLAAIYTDAGQTDKALQHLAYLLNSRGGETFGDAELEYHYARCMIQSGKFHDGLPFAQRAQKAEPRNPKYAHVLGLCLMGVNRYEEAASMLAAGQRMNQGDAESHLQLGEALFLNRKWDAAEKAWLDGIRKFPDSYALLTRLVDYYLGAAKPDQARKVLVFAESKNPAHPGNLLLDVRLQRKLSSYAGAWKSLARLKRQACGPLALEALWEEAQLDFETGKYGSCGKILDNLLLAKHRKTDAHLLKAKLALQSGDKAAAQAHVLQAKSDNPYDLKVYALAGDAFRGENEKLADLLKDGMALMPESDVLYAQAARLTAH